MLRSRLRHFPIPVPPRLLGATSSLSAMSQGYLSDVFLLLLLQGHQDEDLLQLLIAVVDDELLEAVVLREKGPKWQVHAGAPSPAPRSPQQQEGPRWVLPLTWKISKP